MASTFAFYVLLTPTLVLARGGINGVILSVLGLSTLTTGQIGSNNIDITLTGDSGTLEGGNGITMVASNAPAVPTTLTPTSETVPTMSPVFSTSSPTEATSHLPLSSYNTITTTTGVAQTSAGFPSAKTTTPTIIVSSTAGSVACPAADLEILVAGIAGVIGLIAVL